MRPRTSCYCLASPSPACPPRQGAMILGARLPSATSHRSDADAMDGKGQPGYSASTRSPPHVSYRAVRAGASGSHRISKRAPTDEFMSRREDCCGEMTIRDAGARRADANDAASAAGECICNAKWRAGSAVTSGRHAMRRVHCVEGRAS